MSQPTTIHPYTIRFDRQNHTYYTAQCPRCGTWYHDRDPDNLLVTLKGNVKSVHQNCQEAEENE